MDDEDEEDEEADETDDDFKSSFRRSPEWFVEAEISIDLERHADDEADEGHDIDEDVGVNESCESLQLAPLAVMSGLMSELIWIDGFDVPDVDDDDDADRRCDEEDDESDVGAPLLL